jgi:hypothetical protein
MKGLSHDTQPKVVRFAINRRDKAAQGTFAQTRRACNARCACLRSGPPDQHLLADCIHLTRISDEWRRWCGGKVVGMPFPDPGELKREKKLALKALTQTLRTSWHS